jgi:hypothetical protein
MAAHAVLYSRDLPGGGYVIVDAGPAGGAAGGHRARLVVERRAEPARRAGHAPPVIAQCEAPDADSAGDPLRGIAADNVRLALALRKWAHERRPAAS